MPAGGLVPRTQSVGTQGQNGLAARVREVQAPPPPVGSWLQGVENPEITQGHFGLWVPWNTCRLVKFPEPRVVGQRCNLARRIYLTPSKFGRVWPPSETQLAGPRLAPCWSLRRLGGIGEGDSLLSIRTHARSQTPLNLKLMPGALIRKNPPCVWKAVTAACRVARRRLSGKLVQMDRPCCRQASRTNLVVRPCDCRREPVCLPSARLTRGAGFSPVLGPQHWRDAGGT